MSFVSQQGVVDYVRTYMLITYVEHHQMNEFKFKMAKISRASFLGLK